jgi:hypothetical protein
MSKISGIDLGTTSGDKIGFDTRAEVQRAAGDLKREVEGENVAEIKRLTETLNQASHAMAQSRYQQAGPAAGQQSAAEGGHANRKKTSQRLWFKPQS